MAAWKGHASSLPGAPAGRGAEASCLELGERAALEWTLRRLSAAWLAAWLQLPEKPGPSHAAPRQPAHRSWGSYAVTVAEEELGVICYMAVGNQDGGCTLLCLWKAEWSPPQISTPHPWVL